MGEIKLNLARKWRSKNFEEIVGQDLSVRMLKNSLFLQHYFPVYLFSGQRGCGKTTTARVFAMALNCEQLATFRASPKSQPLPCLTCTSCLAMKAGKHPDFIEIDAASHTGVDHVRTLIDSSTLLPLMGNKKIYLIDEAHMLSKSAFNAFLKILEEPPSSVIFMLATTDPQKIIETVRSRCFQLLFRPIDDTALQNHLRMVCEKEQINFEDDGLSMIIRQTGGSARDALNLLETVRFSSNAITHAAVLKTIGHLDDQLLVAIFEAVFSGNAALVLKTVHTIQWRTYSASVMWERFLELIRASLWIKHGVMPEHFTEHIEQLKKLTRHCSARGLVRYLKLMYDQELLFNRTTAQHDLFEMILLQMCDYNKKFNSGGGTPSSAMVAAVTESEEDDEEEWEEVIIEEEIEEEEEEETGGWQAFVRAIAQLNDPLISSVFTQGVVKEHDTATGFVTVEFPKELSFFNDWLQESKKLWQPLLCTNYGDNAILQAQFIGATPAKKAVRRPAIASQKSGPPHARSVRPAAAQERPKKSYQPARFSRKQSHVPTLFANEVPVDTSDAQAWPIAHLVTQHISGTITELRE